MAPGRTTPVIADGVIILSSPLWLERSALPKSAIKLGGREVTIYCPRVPLKRVRPQDWNLLEPSTGRGRLPIATANGYVDWGNYNNTHHRLSVNALRFTAPMDPLRVDEDDTGWTDDRPLTWLREAWPSWFGTFSDWLQAWNRLSRYEGNRQSDTEIEAVAERALLGFNGFVKGTHSIRNHGSHKASTRLEVKAAMRCANEGVRLPLRMGMIVTARTSLHSGRHRECLIDCCTATEVALVDALKHRLLTAGLEVAALEGIVKRANSVSGLATLAMELGLIDKASFTKIKQKLAEPRNRAAHDGTPVDYSVAGEALRVASEIRDQVRPDPSPREILSGQASAGLTFDPR